ncbi:transmembrane protein 127 [Electrophorus electricus]|uniref:transmembrane protein 127 n=1 Tax=Electrophorus electricus TaxID=8005 RepID=UPI0015D03940|nr:transmembrane protein 127 [Electrophorus electricus]
MALGLSPAAVCQCFTLVALCTSIADPNWINVQNGTDPHGKQLIYGVAFTLHAGQNLTDTAPLGGPNGLGMWLLYVLAAFSYASVFASGCSFLLDFLGVGFTHSRVVASFHVSTVVLCLIVLGVAGTCLYVIEHNVQNGRWGSLWDHPSTPPYGLQTYPGESMIIEMLAILFSLGAAAFSLRCPPEPTTPSRYLSVESEDGETEPLIGGLGEQSAETFPTEQS